METTTIKLKKTTRDRLAKEGIKGESFDDIVTTLLDLTESG